MATTLLAPTLPRVVCVCCHVALGTRKQPMRCAPADFGALSPARVSPISLRRAATGGELGSVQEHIGDTDECQCVANACALPPANPINGNYVSCVNVASGGTCLLTCAAGHSQSGNTVCVAGSWSIQTCIGKRLVLRFS